MDMSMSKSVVGIALVGGMVGAAMYIMMPEKKTCEIEEGMRKAADELSGVSKELGRAIKSIGREMMY
ncbi:MAG: hypothetical protein IJC14_02995 [Firmicutes bacterium]|nr:hypothetical protein [Bacillota bacterium]